MSSTPRQHGPVPAVRIELYAPVASFRDPMFPGVTRGLPVPPPSTVRGMLAAASGRDTEPVPLGLSSHHEGRGTDAETYHPIATDGSNPAVSGQVAEGKGGRTLRERPFLVGVHLTVWIPEPDGSRIAAALRRPRWGLRLGRSQDLVHLRSIRTVTLHPADHATIGHALAPAGAHDAPQAAPLRLAETINPERLRTDFGDYLWCASPAGSGPVRGARQDPTDGQAVWLHHPVPPGPPPEELTQVWAKSGDYSSLGRPETLTEHSGAARSAAVSAAERIGSAGLLAEVPRFWSWARTAALLHDAGKIAEGFQRQVRPHGPRWGERHEVLSLAYVDLLTRDLPDQERRMIAAAVACHHRSLNGSGQLAEHYSPVAAWERKFGRDPSARPGDPRIQVPKARHRALLDWFAHELRTPIPDSEPRKLWEIARDAFARVVADWSEPVSDREGLVAVLLQGALTLADHAASAHVAFQTHMPLPDDYLQRLPAPYPHQKDAGTTGGHLVLRAPTGSGKTEAGLAWASHQLATLPARPRLVWVLPYRASIDAARDRFLNGLDSAPGHEQPDIAVLHAGAARTLLTRAADDHSNREDSDDASMIRDHAAAAKAAAQANAMRCLFAQRVRVATPHQLLRAAIAGPRYSSLLLEQANALIVLDELHAYDPVTFGRICAAMRLWERLGSRVAVLSATLAPPMLRLVADTLHEPVAKVEADPATAADRHRLALDEAPLTDSASLERIRTWLQEGRSVLVVANTVAGAQQLYADLAEDARTAAPDEEDAAILLHSRFRGRDRAAIEQRILARHGERRPDDPACRGGGLVVTTQCLEVSLCLDFDRGASELAPVEALAQRAGRVNRLGLHPEGPVEFRVHRQPGHRPYDEDALDAAWQALTRAPGPVISEATINEWLTLAYDTDWGREWLERARRARDDFARSFLTFTDPFEDRSHYSRDLDQAFDTVEVLHHDDTEEYRDLANRHFLLAAGLLIPITFGQFATHQRTGRITFDHRLQTWVTDLPYDTETGLDLAPATAENTPVETVL